MLNVGGSTVDPLEFWRIDPLEFHGVKPLPQNPKQAAKLAWDRRSSAWGELETKQIKQNMVADSLYLLHMHLKAIIRKRWFYRFSTWVSMKTGGKGRCPLPLHTLFWEWFFGTRNLLKTTDNSNFFWNLRKGLFLNTKSGLFFVFEKGVDQCVKVLHLEESILIKSVSAKTCLM